MKSETVKAHEGELIKRYPKPPEGPPPSSQIIPGEAPFVPENPVLAKYVEEMFPKYELYGPIYGIPHMEVPAAPEGQNLVFVEADFSGNGLNDYAAIIRSKFHDEISFLIAFIQLEEGQFTDYKLMSATIRCNYIYPITVKDLRALSIKRHYETVHTFIDDSEVPGDATALMVGKIHRPDRAYLFTKTSGCNRPYCLALLGID